MRALFIFITTILILSAGAEAAIVVNKYTNDFSLQAQNNEQIKACGCETKTDRLMIENVGNFHANFKVEIISPKKEWMTLTEDEFNLAPKDNKQITNYINVPCGEVGEYDYTVRVTNNYGREETIHRTVRADTCQNIALDVNPKDTTANLCEAVAYDIRLENVGTYEETYALSTQSYEEFVTFQERETSLAPGEEHRQTATLQLPCELYGEFEIPFTAKSQQNQIESQETVTLTVENQFDHTIDVETSEKVCSRVDKEIPVTITNEIDVKNEYDITIRGPDFVDVGARERTLELEGRESETIIITANAEQGMEGAYTLTITVKGLHGEIEKTRDVTLNVEDCYDFETELRGDAQQAITQDARCCGLEEYSLNIKNAGQTRETYEILPAGPEWFKPAEERVTLEPGENTNIKVYADLQCTDAVHEIPITVRNARFPTVNETFTFTLESQTQKTCHMVAIDQDESEIKKETKMLPVLVEHQGVEGGVYDIALDSELFVSGERSVELAPGEKKTIRLETRDLEEHEFGRYISQPILTYTPEENPHANIQEPITYVEHVGTELKDDSIMTKATEWTTTTLAKPGVCGWACMTLFVIAAIIAGVFIAGKRTQFKKDTAKTLKVAFTALAIILLASLAFVGVPTQEDLYEMPEDPGEHFVIITQGGQESIELSQYFEDPDGDMLTYTATQPSNLAATIEGSTLTLTPDNGFTGEDEIVITAEDGRGGYADSPVLTTYVVPRKDTSFLALLERYSIHCTLALLLVIVLLLLLFAMTNQRRRGPKNGFLTSKHKTSVKRAPRKRAAKSAVAAVKSASKRVTPRTLAQRRAMDRALVSSEEHEMKQVLSYHGKRQTAENIEALREALKKFKADKRFKPNNRERFYQYLSSMGVLEKLSSTKKVAKKNPGLDRALVSSEEHEMKQVLSTLGKKQTNKNVETLRELLKDFKASRYKPKNRESFYRYLQEQDVLRRLRNA